MMNSDINYMKEYTSHGGDNDTKTLPRGSDVDVNTSYVSNVVHTPGRRVKIPQVRRMNTPQGRSDVNTPCRSDIRDVNTSCRSDIRVVKTPYGGNNDTSRGKHTSHEGNHGRTEHRKSDKFMARGGYKSPSLPAPHVHFQKSPLLTPTAASGVRHQKSPLITPDRTPHRRQKSPIPIYKGSPSSKSRKQRATANDSGSIHTGELRINARNASAFVSMTPMDIMIVDVEARNGAWHGDIVTIRINDRKKWWSLNNDIYDHNDDVESGKLEGRIYNPNHKLSLPDKFIRPTAKVLNIVKRTSYRTTTGFLSFVDSTTCLFNPQNSCFPIMHVPMKELPDHLSNALRDENNDINHRLVAVELMGWTKENYTIGIGQFIKDLGDIDDINTHNKAFLYAFNIKENEFSTEVLACLPPDPSTWRVPASSNGDRADLRDMRIFTIDGASSKDLDDAISVLKLDDGILELGVHIADVSAFVEPGTALDKEAFERGTTTYLVHTALHMLPNSLCESLCSLSPGEERYSVSIFWHIRISDGAILKEWCCRSVVKSCMKLTYDVVQNVIEGARTMEDALQQNAPILISKGHEWNDIVSDLLCLYDLATVLRKARFDAGALSLDHEVFGFELDATGFPTSLKQEVSNSSRNLIEELMILANTSVARRIYSAAPTTALLRSQGLPLELVMNRVIRNLNNNNVHLDGSTAGSLHESLLTVERLRSFNSLEMIAINKMLTKPMRTAQYVCSGSLGKNETTQHFALNVPFYTHFTSPIRRYADIAVHRLLTATLRSKDGDGGRESSILHFSPFREPYKTGDLILPPVSIYSDSGLTDTDTTSDIAVKCSTRKAFAKSAQRQCLLSYLCFYLNIPGVSPYHEAIVFRTKKDSFDIVVSGLDNEQTIKCDSCNMLESFEWNKKSNTLTLFWEPPAVLQREHTIDEITSEFENLSTTENSKEIQRIEFLTKVIVKLTPTFQSSPPNLTCELIHPTLIKK